MDLYLVLGVPRSASGSEIRRAYQKLARRLHPDLNPGDPVAAERFSAVSRAFEVLGDAQRRQAYDRGELPNAPPPPVSPVGFEGFDFSVEVRGSGAGFRELFDPVLRPPGVGDGPARGEDLEQAVSIRFEESLSGAQRRLQLVRSGRCPACRGSGEVATPSVRCPRCAGSGRRRATRGHMIFSRACEECHGTGAIASRACGRCDGEGRTIQGEWLDVQIPAGVADGSKLRLAECGNAGRRGGPAGDLVVTVVVEPHRLFRREGDDLLAVVPITLGEATLGAHVEVQTPDGPVTIEVPAGTQTGQRFRLRKRGAPRLGGAGRGDLYVEAKVAVPALNDDQSRRLMQEIMRANPQNPREGL